MKNVKEQKLVFQAEANIKKTWEDLIAEADVEDRDKPLSTDKYENRSHCDKNHKLEEHSNSPYLDLYGNLLDKSQFKVICSECRK